MHTNLGVGLEIVVVPNITTRWHVGTSRQLGRYVRVQVSDMHVGAQGTGGGLIDGLMTWISVSHEGHLASKRHIGSGPTSPGNKTVGFIGLRDSFLHTTSKVGKLCVDTVILMLEGVKNASHFD